ncbi:Nif3-like dinuclear metal center hexameric protein [Dolosicoccus paucivorans]|uniref:GTP cyclohydrolase 1 type 2 homolog n=1 Tax=Dolosicoccus paucivorans TaxID=84521 RepID=A0A1G8KXL7_9LACT|nr:Nif3-like dinuclear metal center hexameric protein [Dolosicoccus paucivorans]PMB85134.1 Nif3-like dinuclear metal center hexameric protein [Dolosicoccus paucivorans]PMC58936.1 Nif3-like dinuclear metal center hexameric protein [Dolosicoccus paucivorans]SDI48142.1 dinuclear metal center protein, YbgI/SA1388 family [Dolosicoccus paucivorans]
MTIKLKDLTQKLTELYPLDMAQEWDEVGLHFGGFDRSVHKILTSLDLTMAVVDEAIEEGIDTIIVHHPPLFKPIKRFDLSSPEIKLYEKVIKNDLNVYALHTNLDQAHNGMNDWLSEQLQLENISSFYEDTKDNLPTLGRVGELTQPLTRQEVLEHIAKAFDLQTFKIMEKEPQSTYQRIAIIGGSGSSLMEEVSLSQPDIFITGDITFHTGQALLEESFMTIDAGHYIEHIFNTKMNEVIQKIINDQNWPLTCQPSQKSSNPFEVYKGD